MRKLFTFFALLLLTAGLWASSTITYTAIAKLEKVELNVGTTTVKLYNPTRVEYIKISKK